jgi:hypothetical protein
MTMTANPYDLSAFTPGTRVRVEHEGLGYVESTDPSSIYVRIDEDGVLVAAAPEQTFILEEGPPPAPRCPACQRVMSNREAAEQGSCNDCFGGAWSPA